MERATALAHFFESVHSIPDDIQQCLLTIAQYGCHPDQVRAWYITVRQHFGADGQQTGGAPMDSNIELPSTPHTTSAPSASRSTAAPVASPATRRSSIESTGVRNMPLEFWSPGLTEGDTNFAVAPGPAYPGTMAFPRSSGLPATGEPLVVDSGSAAPATTRLYPMPSGLGITQASLPLDYTFAPSTTGVPLLVPQSEAMDGFSAMDMSTTSATAAAFPNFIHTPPQDPSYVTPPRKRVRSSHTTRAMIDGRTGSPVRSGPTDPSTRRNLTVARAHIKYPPASPWRGGPAGPTTSSDRPAAYVLDEAPASLDSPQQTQLETPVSASASSHSSWSSVPMQRYP